MKKKLIIVTYWTAAILATAFLLVSLDYELWKDSGVTFMTLKSNGLYSCQWKDINNALFRVGNKLDCTKTWEELGEISIDYGAHYFH